MRLENISNNFHRVYIAGVVLTFSYETLVAVRSGNLKLVTNEKYSRTTSKYINQIQGIESYHHASPAELQIVAMVEIAKLKGGVV